jgi:hypothetical protein
MTPPLDSDDREREAARAGLCASCRHSTTVVSDRGSRFYLCELAKSDPRFPRYPPLPVRTCIGYEPGPTAIA